MVLKILDTTVQIFEENITFTIYSYNITKNYNTSVTCKHVDLSKIL